MGLALLVFVLGACSTGALLLSAFYPRVTRGSTVDKRLDRLAASHPPQHGAEDESSRKRSVEETLREADEKQRANAKKRAKPTLAARLRQADLGWSKNTYYLVCVATGLATYVVALAALGVGMLPGAGFAISGGLLLPHAYVGVRRRRRFKRFTAEFPVAVDVIVRGIKAGLPLVDCLRIVAAETQQPVKAEFKTIAEDQTMGMPLEDALSRLPERIPLPEASFFAIVVAIQSRTGGSLSEALANLSSVLRERKKMESKIKAMSQEAKASAAIIAALPVVVAGLVYLSSPDYISLLFTTLVGNFVLAGCALWMLMGTLVMRKMINFDF